MKVEEPRQLGDSEGDVRLETTERDNGRIFAKMRNYVNCAVFVAIGGCANVQCSNATENDNVLYAFDDPVWPALSMKLEAMSSGELIQLMDDVFMVKVVFDESPDKDKFSFGTIDDEADKKTRLILQIGALLKYSPTVRDRLEDTKIYNFESCSLDGFKVGGLGKFQEITICSDNIKTFLHEVFHALDDSDGFDFDNASWTAINTNGEDYYLSTSGLQSMKDGTLENASIEGTVSEYGRSCPNEDQAEIGSHLFVPKLASTMLYRQNNDVVLRNKIESLTGTRLNPLGNGGKFYPWEGTPKVAEYFPIWSCDMDERCFSIITDDELCSCKVETDYEYWNTIAVGHMPLFGKTRDEQIKWVTGNN